MDMRTLFLAPNISGPLQSHCWSKKSVTVLGIKLSSACFLFQVCATFKFIPRDVTSSIRLNREQLCSVLAKFITA